VFMLAVARSGKCANAPSPAEMHPAGAFAALTRN